MKKTIAPVLFLFFAFTTKAQNIGIGTNTPHSSAALEIADSSKGILIPRMTIAQRNAIQNPAEGLMVYQTDSTKGFWYWDLASWKNIPNANTVIDVNGTVPVVNGGTGANTIANARANLGATTVGANLFTLQNPSAQKYLRVNADNSVSARSGGEMLSEITTGYAGIVNVIGYGTTVYNSLVTPNSIILVTTQQSKNNGKNPAIVTSKSFGSFTIAHDLAEYLQVAYLIINP